MSTITINGKKYNEKDLSKEAKEQAQSIRLCDVELVNVNNLIAMNRTAKNAYSVALSENLPNKIAPANRKNGVVVINEEKYLIEDFDEKVRNNIYFINSINNKIADLQIQLEIIKTAKTTYSRALVELVNSKK